MGLKTGMDSVIPIPNPVRISAVKTDTVWEIPAIVLMDLLAKTVPYLVLTLIMSKMEYA